MNILILTESNFIVAHYLKNKLENVNIRTTVEDVANIGSCNLRDYTTVYTTNGREQLEVFRYLFSIGEDYRDMIIANLDISWVGEIGNMELAKATIAKALQNIVG